MRWRVTIEQPQQTPDSSGGSATTWVAVATLWAEVRPTSGGERYRAMREQGYTYYKLRLRGRKDVSITTKDRVRMGSKVWNVREVYNEDQLNRWITVIAEEGPGT